MSEKKHIFIINSFGQMYSSLYTYFDFFTLILIDIKLNAESCWFYINLYITSVRLYTHRLVHYTCTL